MQRPTGASPLHLLFIGCLQTHDLDLSLVYMSVNGKWCRIKIEKSDCESTYIKKTGREVLYFTSREAMLEDARALRRYEEGMAYADLIEHTGFTLDELKGIVARALREMNVAA